MSSALRPTVVVEVELAGAGAGWTDLATDVVIVDGLTIRHGIDGSGPEDNVAGAGLASFSLDNSTKNSGAKLGYYSLYHANKRSGWGLGIGCRIRIIDPATSTSRTRCVGRVDGIDPIPGPRGDRRVRVSVSDWMDEAARWTLTPDIGEQVDQPWNTILTAILAEMPNNPTSTSFDVGSDTYPYALDTSAQAKVTALEEFKKLARSEFGLIYLKANGTLRAEGRHSRMTDTTSDWTLVVTDLDTVELPSTRDEILNTVRTTTHARVVDADPTTLIYDQANVIEVGPSETAFLLGPYRNPTTGDPIGATDVQAQVSGTDYLANTANDGSGTDISSDFVIVVTAGPSGASFSVTNNNAAVGYLTRNRLYGQGIYDFGTQTWEATDATSITTHGEHVVNFDMPYQHSGLIGQAAADYMLDKFGDPFAQARRVTVMGKSATLLTQILQRDISDRLSISETVTGLNSAFFINGVELSVTPMGHVGVTYTLAPAADPFAGLYWILGTSALGTNTYLAPF